MRDLRDNKWHWVAGVESLFERGMPLGWRRIHLGFFKIHEDWPEQTSLTKPYYTGVYIRLAIWMPWDRRV